MWKEEKTRSDKSFQLPLSGSLTDEAVDEEKLKIAAFNSLSRDHELATDTWARRELERLSTPSLGITADYERVDYIDGIAFNSLSRDHLED